MQMFARPCNFCASTSCCASCNKRRSIDFVISLIYDERKFHYYYDCGSLDRNYSARLSKTLLSCCLKPQYSSSTVILVHFNGSFRLLFLFHLNIYLS